MEPGGSNQDGGVVNMTRAVEALSPLLNHPRRTIIQVEALVTAAAALLLLQLILGSCRRRWHSSGLRYVLQALNAFMFPLIVYTLSTMQSSPIKNSFYPVWAAFLIMASAGTIAVQQYDFCNSFDNKYLEGIIEYFKYGFYVIMFSLLMNPNTYTLKTAFDPKWRPIKSRLSSYCVIALVLAVLTTKVSESLFLAALGYKQEGSLFLRMINKIIRRAQAVVTKWRTEESGNNDAACEFDSDPQSMKGYKYAVTYHPSRFITIDQIWDSCVNSADGKELKDLSLSCALFQWLVRQHYFGEVYPETSLLKDHDFVFKKLLPSEGDFQRAFRIIEVELGFCYDFFFTKFYYTFALLNSSQPGIQYFGLLRIILILIVGVFAIRKSLVLETPNPIIEVHTSEADYSITLLVLLVALIVELVQAAVYLASNWAQVSVACMHVKKYFFEPNAFIFGKAIGFLRRFMISGVLRNKIDQHSFIFRHKQQPDPVVVSDEVKRAIARSLILTYGNNQNTIGETSLWQNQMFDEYSWALKNLSQLEVMLIWHIATEYCDAISNGCSDGNGTNPTSNHLGAHLFGYVLQLIRPDPRRNSVARDGHHGVAVHLSRYCAYLIRSVPELLPYHKADIAEVAKEVMEERKELYGSDYSLALIYNRMTQEEEDDDPRKMFQKGVKLGKQLVRTQDGDRHWEVLKDFWAETIIHAAASHYTAKQHMQHLENGGEFLTHIWALLSHAGILNLNRGKDQEDQGKPGSGTSAATC